MSTERYVIACDRQLEVLRQLPSTEDEQEAGAELVRLLDASEQRIATREGQAMSKQAGVQMTARQNQIGVKCALCGEKGATVPLHMQHAAGTILMVGDYVHAACLTQSAQVAK